MTTLTIHYITFKSLLPVLILCSFTCAFILLDMITGVLKAFKEHTFTSRKMKDGFFSKIAFILIMILAILIDVANYMFSLGFLTPIAIALPTILIFIEIGSIYENLCKINSQIANLKIAKLFLQNSTSDFAQYMNPPTTETTETTTDTKS